MTATSDSNRTNALSAGNFYGAVEERYERCEAIFTNLRHTKSRKLPSHSHELPFFALLLEGEYGELYQRQEKQFRPFTLHFRPAGIPHQDEIGPAGVRFFEVEIRPSWRHRLDDCSARLDLSYDDCHGGSLLWIAMELYHEFQEADSFDELSIETLVGEMLGIVARMHPENFKTPPPWLRRIMEKLAAEYHERLTLDELSREAGVHPVHLSRVFRKCIGRGIGDYVRRLRIRTACEQMLETELSTVEISNATGFADQSHFTRVFRKITGITPVDFRRKLAQKRRNRIATPGLVG